MIVNTNSSHELMRIYEENISIEQKANETIVKFIPCCTLCTKVRFSVLWLYCLTKIGEKEGLRVLPQTRKNKH